MKPLAVGFRYVSLKESRICKLKAHGQVFLNYAVLEDHAEVHPDGIRFKIELGGISTTLGYITDECPKCDLKLYLNYGDECEVYLEGEGVVGFYIHIYSHDEDVDITVTDA